MAEESNSDDKLKIDAITEPPIVPERSRMPAYPQNSRDVEKHPSGAKIRFLGAAMLVIVSA
ncbi:MAG TPA: hypothetical protein VF733_04660 [Candidatus Saccharimonadales bacterium]